VFWGIIVNSKEFIMSDIQTVQKNFFNALKKLQEEIVYTNLTSYKKDMADELFLFNVTYDVIYRLMELIDGYYGDSNLKLDLIDKKSNKSLRTGIELHDACFNYLKFGS
jgi:hypothetical protein